MPLSFLDFLRQATENSVLLTVTVLTLAVILVNGWTDAPNAIASAVATEALSFRRAVLLAALCNFLGVLCITSVNTSIAQTIYSIADFGGGTGEALTALCAAMAAIVLWAAGAWLFGIPTSESHALVAGISGAAVALEGGFSCIRWESMGKVLLGLVVSTAAGFLAGRSSLHWVSRLDWSARRLRRAQIPGAACTAFFHGAQDGQKFIGVFFLGAGLAQGRQDTETFLIPLWLILLCALVISAGTAMGGGRIIQTIARQMVTPGPREGLAADVGGCCCLLAATLFGLPVSTTHTRTAALLGASSARGQRVSWGTVRTILLAWIFTFPGCFLIGYGMARLFLGILP